jgi:hypothetical protein
MATKKIGYKIFPPFSLVAVFGSGIWDKHPGSVTLFVGCHYTFNTIPYLYPKCRYGIIKETNVSLIVLDLKHLNLFLVTNKLGILFEFYQLLGFSLPVQQCRVPMEYRYYVLYLHA